MKFLCDRCKTRYSIGDERVRGKILKIRCKNCANVITVREGMPEPVAESPVDRAQRNPTQAVPLVDPAMLGGAIGTGALGAAFANQLSKPPPALEEEWYVSIDGVQSGPFSLGDAQRWVQAKPFDAELHCWSEGFDDWLPVDKVSHFRGLRKRPERSTAPPPIPKIPARPSEPEPKPLFAATMASLEKAAEKSSLPAMTSAPTAKGMGAVPAAAKANGTGVAAPMPSTGRGTGPGAAIPSIAPRQNNAPASQGAAALAAAFRADVDNDQLTQVEAPAFNDEIATSAEPYASKRLDKLDAATTMPSLPPASSLFAAAPAAAPATPARAPLAARAPIHHDDEDDNLDIGEVSRVVSLADVAQMGRTSGAQRAPNAQPALRNSGSLTGGVNRVGGLTAGVPKLSPSQLGMNVDPSFAALAPTGEPVPDESIVARSFATRHRRGMLLLITVSAVMVLGVVALVVFFATGTPDEMTGGLGGTRQIDTSRPEDIVRKQLPTPPNGPGSAGLPHKRITTPRVGGNNNTITQVEDPADGGKRLQASEVEDMAAKQGEGTKRCYMRAQKGALGFEIADVKKIEVTLSVNAAGIVTNVGLSSHGADSFGQCLSGQIKRWKFRESTGGTFRISLAFSNS